MGELMDKIQAEVKKYEEAKNKLEATYESFRKELELKKTTVANASTSMDYLAKTAFETACAVGITNKTAMENDVNTLISQKLKDEFAQNLNDLEKYLKDLKKHGEGAAKAKSFLDVEIKRLREIKAEIKVYTGFESDVSDGGQFVGSADTHYKAMKKDFDANNGALSTEIVKRKDEWANLRGEYRDAAVACIADVEAQYTNARTSLVQDCDTKTQIIKTDAPLLQGRIQTAIAMLNDKLKAVANSDKDTIVELGKKIEEENDKEARVLGTVWGKLKEKTNVTKPDKIDLKAVDLRTYLDTLKGNSEHKEQNNNEQTKIDSSLRHYDLKLDELTQKGRVIKTAMAAEPEKYKKDRNEIFPTRNEKEFKKLEIMLGVMGKGTSPRFADFVQTERTRKEAAVAKNAEKFTTLESEYLAQAGTFSEDIDKCLTEVAEGWDEDLKAYRALSPASV